MQYQSTDEFEHEMERRNNTAVVFKNIDDEDFTHNYAGFPKTIKAREKVILTYPMAMLFAQHLAMKILRKKKNKQYEGKRGDVPTTLNLYPKAEVEALKAEIIVEQIEQPLEQKETDREREQKKLDDLKDKFKDKLEDKPAAPEVSKKEIIEELKQKGIKFDPRVSKEELLQLITENEMKK